jgi:hypothetical protein
MMETASNFSKKHKISSSKAQLPVHGDFDMQLMYGWERINNVNLVGGINRTNQIVKVDLSYRY